MARLFRAAVMLIVTVFVVISCYYFKANLEIARTSLPEAARDTSAANSDHHNVRSKLSLHVHSNQSGLQLQLGNRASHQRNAVNRIPTAINLKKHVSFKILKPLSWTLLAAINPHRITPEVQRSTSPGAGETFFSVKTTRRNHATRLPILMMTWMQTVLASQVCRTVLASEVYS